MQRSRSPISCKIEVDVSNFRFQFGSEMQDIESPPNRVRSHASLPSFFRLPVRCALVVNDADSVPREFSGLPAS